MILGRYQHPSSACFDEIDFAVRAIDKAAGRTRDVCFNAHLYEAPPGAIIYNLEDAFIPSNDSAFVLTDPGALWAGHEVWDFDEANAKAYGAKFVPLGHHASMERFKPHDEDLDVVFYGVMNPHRKKILDGLTARGLKVLYMPRCYGKTRDMHLSRAKLALNMQYNVAGTWPSLRVAHLCSNRVPVLSEAHPEMWPFIRSAPYDDLIDTAERLARGPASERAGMADHALTEFRKMPLELPS